MLKEPNQDQKIIKLNLKEVHFKSVLPSSAHKSTEFASEADKNSLTEVASPPKKSAIVRKSNKSRIEDIIRQQKLILAKNYYEKNDALMND